MTPSSHTLETAFQHHLRGQLDRARACYEEVVSQHSHQGAALHGLAMIALEDRLFEDAVGLAERAAEALPEIAQVCNTLGRSYDATGQKDKAVNAFQKAVTLQPDFAEAYHYMAQCHHALGDTACAVQSYEQAVRIKPDFVQAHLELAQLYQAQNQLESAIKTLEHILTLAPDSAEVHTRTGMILRRLNRDGEARQHYLEAIRLQPAYAPAHNNLGNLLSQYSRYEDAMYHYEQAIRISDTCAESFNNLGATLIHLNRVEEAVTQCHKAIALKPEYAEAHNTLASALMKLGRYTEATDAFNRTLTLSPDYAEAHSNLAMIHLVLKYFEAGWQEYEWRLRCPGFTKRYSAPQPRWDGSPFPGKTLLVHWEQGMGDSIQFIRYLPRIKALGGTVLYQDRPPLHRLFSRHPGIDQFISTAEPNMPRFDLQASVMSLPYLFGTCEHSIPSTSVYLHAEVDKIKNMQPHIQPHAFNVGIVWAGSKTHKNNKNRSCDPALFQTLAQCPGIALYGLQKTEDTPAIPESLKSCLVANLGEHFQDFSDTAGAIAHMDLVVTVDTSVLHLACAMGKPTWALIPFTPDWRWMLDRSDSPWYPTLRLFRQAQPGQWQPVFDAIAELLDHTVRHHRSP
ncbi:MAG: tetratricopeptide repeat protein [Planctomycetes bacterium]|nr:tetratricopeptide repeat protein [Planctomycetota bacterium]